MNPSRLLFPLALSVAACSGNESYFPFVAADASAIDASEDSAEVGDVGTADTPDDDTAGAQDTAADALEDTPDDAGDTVEDTVADSVGDTGSGDVSEDPEPDAEVEDAQPDTVPDVEPDTVPDVEPDAEPDVEPDAEPDVPVEPVNRLANPGFELGETWQRPGGWVNHQWSRTGDQIYESDATFTAREGRYAFKIWGYYSGGVVPNDSEHSLHIADLTPGDEHVFSAHVFTHADDQISGGNQVVLFVRYLDSAGSIVSESTSSAITEASETNVWHELSVVSSVPERASNGVIGVRYTLAEWASGGSVYLDDASWTSSGSGAVEGERLLVWNDEFDGSSLNEDNWTRLVLPAYTFNAEMQRYTPSTENADVRDGALVITAREEFDGSITSARLITDGKAEWTYGRVEARLRVPSGIGTWPAFWMLPSDNVYGGWPASGELDIMEHVGCGVGDLFATVHTGAFNHLLGTQRGGETRRDDAAERYHIYSMDWSEDEIVFYVDDELIFRFENDGAGDSNTWPFNQTFHIVLNLAFGGTWGGWCGVDTLSLPQEYRIDWVRTYQ